MANSNIPDEEIIDNIYSLGRELCKVASEMQLELERGKMDSLSANAYARGLTVTALAILADAEGMRIE